MKVSVHWLKQLVDIDMSVADLAHTLTMAGLEVEDISPVAPPFDKVVVAEVKAVTAHPNADKLRVCEVNVGGNTHLQIVCGAPNVAPGMRVPCALIGAKLFDLEIKAAKLRGVESSGMLCSARELGISTDHEGLLALPGDAPIGQDIRQYLDLDDVYLTLKLTPNRGDCLSMLGIARDLAAITGGAVKLSSPLPVAETTTAHRSITLDAGKACSRYCGRVVQGVNAQAVTPSWMKRRLERAGFRSIAPLVDITNYVMLERGQPMHAFDDDKLQGGIEVRFPRAGEQLTLLNEQNIELTSDMLLIADQKGPIALAGVMGGRDSMVTDHTRNVFFESACFNPDVIQGKARLLGFNSDAAYRFERGVDPAGARDALEYATRLALEICGRPETQVGPVNDAQAMPPHRDAVVVRPHRISTIVGRAFSEQQILNVLQRLNCVTECKNGAIFAVPPSYRFDLNIEEDFAEEVARITGFDAIPAAVPRATISMLPFSESKHGLKRLRQKMVDMGYQEVINYSFISDQWEMDFSGNPHPVRLANPIASHMNVMRSSLIGGLVQTLVLNLNHGEQRLQLFEMGRCFSSDTAQVAMQPEKIAGLAYGSRYPEQWGEKKDERTDFFAIKGDIELLCGRLPVRFEKTPHPACHPGRCAAILLNEEAIGFIGELHPQLQQKYELPLAPVLFELLTNQLTKLPAMHFSLPSRMPAVRRDIALLVDENIPVQALIDAIAEAKIANMTDFSLFDVYRGVNLQNGKKSLAFRIVIQDTEKTFTDVEVDEKISRVIDILHHKFGVTIRK